MRLVETGVETNVYHRVLWFVVNALHTKCFEEERLRFFKDFFAHFCLCNVVSNLNGLGCFGTPDRGIGWIGEEVLAQSFREWTLKVGDVQCYAFDLEGEEES